MGEGTFSRVVRVLLCSLLVLGACAPLTGQRSSTLAPELEVPAREEPVAHTSSDGAFGPRLSRVLSGETFSVPIPVTNPTDEIWPASGAFELKLAYHWLDAQGRAVVWDGLRTSLDRDLDPGESRVVAATVRAPDAPGPYTLAFELVREGMGWLGAFARVASLVELPRPQAAYDFAADGPYRAGSEHAIPVTIRNTGNMTLSAASGVAFSYHWYEASGKRVITWDAPRTSLAGDIPPGAARNVSLRVAMPRQVGIYWLEPQLVQEGRQWIPIDQSAARNRVKLRVTTDLNADYEVTTTPSSITPGAEMPVSVVVRNVGLAPWSASSVAVSYHWYDEAGKLVTWDGSRGSLSSDVPYGVQASTMVRARAPNSPGVYTIEWDVVEEGKEWVSAQSGVVKRETIVVAPGITFYGKGWGHGVGLSQWGAQGWAEGATGTALNAEQIVAKYYPGARLTQLTEEAKPIRVLLSSPSSACISRTISNVARMRSTGGMRVIREGDVHPMLTAAPGQTVRLYASGGAIAVMDEWAPAVIYAGGGSVMVAPLDPSEPVHLDQKGLGYRGTLHFEVPAPGRLRAVNHVNAADYMRGSLPGEMPAHWHMEALRAQAYAGLSYAMWRQSRMTSFAYDVRDDTSDQCYGGAGFESPRTDEASRSTAGTILTYDGKPIRAYYTSSNGGMIETNACVWDLDKERRSLACGSTEPYLRPADDAGDLAAYDNRKGANPHRLWSASFTGPELRSLVLEGWGVDIGEFVSIDIGNRSAAGYVLSVLVRGTRGSVEVRGGAFLRGTLALKSSLVHLTPF